MLAASARIDPIRRALRTSDSKHDRLIHGETARADLAVAGMDVVDAGLK